jgi:type IV pilus assembly protein PilM
VAARREMIDRVLQAVRSAGLRPEGIDLSAFAMVRALHRADTSQEQVLYMAIGGLTNVAVAQGTSCRFTRASGTGLETMAVELAERRQLTLEHARGWLVHVGLDTPLEEIEGDEEIVAETRHVLLDGVRRIASGVRTSLDFHHGQGDDVAVTRAVLTGPAAGVPGFAAALGAELRVPVEEGAVTDESGVLQTRLTVAAGLAIEEAVQA